MVRLYGHTNAVAVICLALLFPGHFSGLAQNPPNSVDVQARVNSLFHEKLQLYAGSLPEEQQRNVSELRGIADHVGPTLRFLYHDVFLHILDLGMEVPELGSLFSDEAPQLFGNITYGQQYRAALPFELNLRMLLHTLNTFNPYRFTTLLTAYPIARRAVAALLLEKYLEAASAGTQGGAGGAQQQQPPGFTAAEAELVIKVCKRLFDLHKQAAHTKRIIEFFHVSKSGGTTFCQLGQRNGCQTQNFDIRQNCLIRYFRDAPRWTVEGRLGALSKRAGDPWCARFGHGYSERWPCRSRRELMTKMRFNFYANELAMHDHNRTMLEVHPCREFLNVVIFREPHDRILSHLQNILKEYIRFSTFHNDSLWNYFDPKSADQWRELAPPVLDNYVVRSLLGRHAFRMPYGQVNATHLLVAKVIALQFEVVLSLTEQSRELTKDIFGLGLGWHTDLRHLHARPGKAIVADHPPSVMELVARGRTYDQGMYEYALILQLVDALVFGVAHDMAGVGVGGDVAPPGGGAGVTPAGSGSGSGSGSLPGAQSHAASVLLGNASSAAAAESAGSSSSSGARSVCGYIGAKRKRGKGGKLSFKQEATNATDAPAPSQDGVLPAGGRWVLGHWWHSITAEQVQQYLEQTALGGAVERPPWTAGVPLRQLVPGRGWEVLPGGGGVVEDAVLAITRKQLWPLDGLREALAEKAAQQMQGAAAGGAGEAGGAGGAGGAAAAAGDGKPGAGGPGGDVVGGV